METIPWIQIRRLRDVIIISTHSKRVRAFRSQYIKNEAAGILFQFVTIHSAMGGFFV
jgi:hypothetical protein